jgi:hypothetical protein
MSSGLARRVLFFGVIPRAATGRRSSAGACWCGATPLCAVATAVLVLVDEVWGISELAFNRRDSDVCLARRHQT